MPWMRDGRWLVVVACSLATSLLVSCGDEAVSGDPGGAAAKKDGGGETLADLVEGDDAGQDAGETQVDASGAADSGQPDAGAPGQDGGGAEIVGDTGGGGDCPGGVGCTCQGNGDCDTSVCIDMPGGKKCAKLCTEDCPKGFSCENVSPGADTIFACVFKHLALCAPCKQDVDCKNLGVETFCLDYGAEGRFCGGTCKEDADCPAGYGCDDVQGTAGSTAKQCKLKTGLCACSDWAVKSGNKTACSLKNPFGTCSADRLCTKDGLSACEAKTAAAEVCNAVDDDCDGVTDNLAPDYKCSNKLFADLGSKATCTDDAGCTEAGEKCDAKDGLCKTLQGECFGVPSCTAGGVLVCNQAKTPKVELCNDEDDDCDGKTDEDFQWASPDGVTLALGEPCGLGECGGGNVKCGDLKTATCSTAGKSKPEACDNLDDDCNGVTDDPDKVCDDQDACTKNVCDGPQSKCSNPPAVDCDDNEQCTEDTCDKTTGKCANGPLSGVSCDDGNACTEGDLCADKAGKPTCTPGKPKACVDESPCTDASCDPAKGCVFLPNAATQVCYSGPEKSLGKGECKAGVKHCKDGVLGESCLGEFTPNNTEICDKKDDDCDGIVDNGCAATLVRVAFSSGAGRLEDGKRVLRARLGGDSNAGAIKGDKSSLLAGFLAWVRAL